MLPSPISQQRGLLTIQTLHGNIFRMSASRSDIFLHALRLSRGQGLSSPSSVLQLGLCFIWQPHREGRVRVAVPEEEGFGLSLMLFANLRECTLEVLAAILPRVNGYSLDT